MGTGKARAPHNKERPESAAVKKALEQMDIEALGIALTPRQRRFCDEYVLDYNGAAAVVRAGYSKKYCDRMAHTLLRNAGVRAYIDYLAASKAAKIMSVDPDYIINGIVGIVSKDGGRDGDKLRGYELLARIMGMFIDKQEITGRDGEAIRIEQQRVEEETASVINLLNGMRRKEKAKKQ